LVVVESVDYGMKSENWAPEAMTEAKLKLTR
jgi:hypothetical protein